MSWRQKKIRKWKESLVLHVTFAHYALITIKLALQIRRNHHAPRLWHFPSRLNKDQNPLSSREITPFQDWQTSTFLILPVHFISLSWSVPFSQVYALSSISIPGKFLEDDLYLIALLWSHKDGKVRASIFLLLPGKSSPFLPNDSHSDWAVKGHYRIKNSIVWELALWLRKLKPGLCNNLNLKGLGSQPKGWEGVGGERKIKEGRDTYVPMADSCWCMAEANIMLLSLIWSVIYNLNRLEFHKAL